MIYLAPRRAFLPAAAFLLLFFIYAIYADMIHADSVFEDDEVTVSY